MLDKDGKPMRVNGILLYTSIPSTEVTRTVIDSTTGLDFDEYLYGEADLIEDTIRTGRNAQGKVIVRGQLKNSTLDAIEAHLELRKSILSSPDVLIKNITGHSFAMVNSGEYVKNVFHKLLVVI